ncbi:MAG: restriction endonuclease subunit S [Thermodesulfobacteriota bacterium]
MKAIKAEAADNLPLSQNEENEGPEGWVFPQIRDILEINYGKGLTEAKRKGGQIPVYGSNGVVGYHDAPLTDGQTIILGRKGTVGAVHFSTGPCWPIDTTYFIHNFRGLRAEYVFYALRSIDLPGLDKSSAIPGINRDDIYSQAIPIPPLAEQERIVAKVDELLTGVNAARERLAKVPGILKRFRQAVLAAACSGRLTADWRAGQTNLKPALKRDDSVQDAFDDMAENWRSTKMRKLTTTITSGSRGWAKYYCEKGAIFIRSHDINTDNLRLETVAHVNPPLGAEGRRTQVNSGDLLITITGANVTRAALVRGKIPEAYISQHVALVRLSNIEWGGFLYLWIISPAHGRKELLDAAYGAGKPGLNLDNIRDLVVALPPVPEQHEIVRRVEALFRLADAIEARVAAATARAGKLTQAILAKAFRGELVPTEAELARREGREYEPAAALLERLKEERRQTAHSQPPRKTKRKTGISGR